MDFKLIDLITGFSPFNSLDGPQEDGLLVEDAELDNGESDMLNDNIVVLTSR